MPYHFYPDDHDGPVIDVPAPNPVMRYLRDVFTSPYTWGFVIAAFLVKLVQHGAPLPGWFSLAGLIGIAWACTRARGRWRNPNPPADPGWGVRAFMILAYLAVVGSLLLWAIWMT